MVLAIPVVTVSDMNGVKVDLKKKNFVSGNRNDLALPCLKYLTTSHF